MVQTDEELRKKGLEIIAFPCNQFGNQEPGTPTQIEEFIRGKYSGKFPIMAKGDVNGQDAQPMYVHLRTNSELYDE